jgi:hypothetical protein
MREKIGRQMCPLNPPLLIIAHMWITQSLLPTFGNIVGATHLLNDFSLCRRRLITKCTPDKLANRLPKAHR